MIEPGTATRFVLWALGAWLVAVWVAATVYVVVSYVESIGHVPRQSPAAAARSMLREVWYAAWTQPLLPLFQLMGKHLGTGGGTVPVVMVHGYFQNRVDFLYLARRLLAAGCGPLYGCNFFWPQHLERSSESVRDFVRDVLAETGAEKVDLLAHSSGGLLALDLLAERPDWIRRTAVVAIPYKGVTWRGPVLGTSGSQLRADSAYTRRRPAVIEGGPVLSVFSAHDNLVHPEESSTLTGDRVTNVRLEELGHLSILFAKDTADTVCDFLMGADEDVLAVEGVNA